MLGQHAPKTGNKLFLMQRQVVVIKIYKDFHFAKVRYSEDTCEFFVDVCALTYEPENKNSISLGILRRDCDEQHSALY